MSDIMDGLNTGTTGNAPSTGSQNVQDNVIALLAPFNRNQIAMMRDTKIAEDLEVDSVAIFDIIMDVEDSYEITFPMEAIGEIKTIGELSDMIETLRA